MSGVFYQTPAALSYICTPRYDPYHGFEKFITVALRYPNGSEEPFCTIQRHGITVQFFDGILEHRPLARVELRVGHDTRAGLVSILQERSEGYIDFDPNREKFLTVNPTGTISVGNSGYWTSVSQTRYHFLRFGSVIPIPQHCVTMNVTQSGFEIDVLDQRTVRDRVFIRKMLVSAFMIDRGIQVVAEL
ncbi:hypothetical protein BDZ97DRAFT_1819046 [Flammula alnicola]|nr:hypothetical protein BDZ97DRAFT_1819046 [Flammula alnicola]